MDIDDLYMEYADLVEAGEIDPAEISVEQYVEDKIADLIDRAHDRSDMER